MRVIATITATLALLSAVNAQVQPATVVTSFSGQVVVSSRGGSFSAPSIELGADPRMITLQPALLTVSCERIKQEMLRDLDMQDHWRGKIFIVLRPAASADDQITFSPRRFGGNWNCSIEMPEVIDRDRLVVTVVRALLLEIANRNATSSSTEVPEWLAQGLAWQLIGSAEMRLILKPPTATENGLSVNRVDVDLTDAPNARGKSTRRMNPLADAIETFRIGSPLTFEELSWPSEEQLSGNAGRLYSASAQLFVSQLLRQKKGPENLQAMLAKLPDYLNWQLAFMEAFHGQFKKPLDVEKWWALEVVQFTGRDLLHLWNREESSKQLDALCRFPIEVKIGEGPPMRTDITFQTIIRGWSRTRQLQMLQRKLWELNLVRLRISPDFVPLVDDYRMVLSDYYKERNKSPKILRREGLIPEKALEEAVKQLDELDARRAALRRPNLPMASATGTAPEPVP
jgi:hypothetical protein